MITIQVTKEQAEEIYRALVYLYEKYEDNNEYHNEYVYNYNNSVDELRTIVKDAIENDKQ